MQIRRMTTILVLLTLGALPLRAEVCNLRVVTDASPDYTDMPGLIHSVTSAWPTPAEKCWAMFYWNHIARRQTNPMNLHGMALTDPIRQFNDYGFTMCSTISGINCGIWNSMGLPARYWDISNHTVAEVFYDDKWHMYDNSLSALYTLCDGKTLAGVADIGKELGCAASGGRVERGHIAKYHCLTATSPNGFLSGADTARSLDEESHCFATNALKYRSYYYDQDLGHRYILNLRDNESYTRYYHSLGTAPEYFVPNGAKDPEQTNPRYRIRGNGTWTFTPSLTREGLADALHSSTNIEPADGGGLRPAKAGEVAEAVFRVQSANVMTAQLIAAEFTRAAATDDIRILVSASNGQHWRELWKAEGTGKETALIDYTVPVNGEYEVLIKVRMLAKAAAGDTVLKSLKVVTTTELNSKTQPKLNVGRNTVSIGAGDQTDSIVFWPELQADAYKKLIVEEKNITSAKKHPDYMGTIYPTTAKEDGFIVYRLDAPRDLTRVVYGGRFYNRAPKSHIDLLHSFDDGKTWTKSWSLTETKQPWDVVHYETVEVPAGHASVLVKYLMNTTEASTSGCSIFAVRMEANFRPATTTFKPIEATFKWKEVQKDRSLIERSHTQLIDKLPARYTIDVGGEDHPAMESLTVGLKGSQGALAQGYSDGKDAGGEKHIGRWVKYGRNLAIGKTYTCSAPSGSNWGAGDPDGKKLTDGVCGPSYAGGTSYKSGLIWPANTNPTITLDLGAPVACASFGMNFHGYEFWDALKGQVKDKVEVLVSDDGQSYKSIGFLETDLRWKDLPVNHMWPDDEMITGHTFRLIVPKPVTARYVQYKVASKRFFCATELEVLDSISFDPFDLRIALPEAK